MKAWIIILILEIAVVLASGAPKTPINNGILQSDLNAAGYKILSANLSDYAGANMTWNTVTGKFDATGGGGGTGSPGGSTTQIQYNNAGAFNGVPTVTYDGTIPLTISKDGGADTRFTGIKLVNPTSAVANSEGRQAPAIHLIEKTKDSGGTAHTYDHMIWGEAGSILFGTSTDGSAVGGTGHAIVQIDSQGNILPYSGDAVIRAAQFDILDFAQIGNNNLQAVLENSPYGTLRMAGTPGFGNSRIVWTDGPTYATTNLDTAIGRSEVGGVGIYSGYNSSTLGLLRVSTQSQGDNSTKAATTAYADTAGLKWDGGATNLVAATGRTSLGLVIGTNVEAWDADLDTWATLTPSANFQTMVPHTFAQMRTDLGGTTVGQNLFTATNPSALSYPKISATNTVSFLSPASVLTDIGAQASSANLTSWAAITRASGFDTFVATPSSANLRGVLTDENGTGAALFSGATTPDFTTGFTIGVAAGSGKVMKGNGTNFVPSTETYAAPGTSGNVMKSDGTNWTSSATLTTTRVNPRVTSIASNATWSPSADTDDVYEITAQAAAVTVISNPTGTPVDGQSLIIRFSDNGTPRALTWSGTQWQAGPGLALPTSTIVGNHDYVGFKWNSTTSKWTMVASTQLNGTVDDTAYASSWNGVTGIGPSKNAVYDELHLIDTADNGTIVNAGTGFTVAGAAPINYELTGNGTNFISKASDIPNGSSAQQTGFSANTYLAGSVITISAGDFKAGSTYRCMFDMTKTTAGTAAPVITIYIGTAGTTADTAAQTITFAAATGVADTGMFEVWVNFRAVGASATISSVGRCVHNLAITGLTSTGASGSGTVSNTTSSTFNSTAMTKIGVAFNGGASYVGTNNIVQAYYSNP